MSEKHASVIVYANRILELSLLAFVAFFAVGRSFREAPIFLMLGSLLVKRSLGVKLLPSTRLNRPFLLFAIALLLSAVFSSYISISLEKFKDILKAYIVFIAASHYIRGEKEMRRILYAFVFLCVLQGIDCIYQIFNGFDLIKRVPMNGDRVTGSFYPGVIGNLMALTIPMFFILLEVSERTFIKICLTLTMIFPILALLLSKTRSAWVSFSVAFIVMFTFSKRRLLYIPVLISPFIFFLLAPVHQVERLKTIPGFTKQNERIEIWATAIQMFKASPIVGTGVGTFKDLYGIYRVDLPNYDMPGRVAHPHNIYLHSLVEMGIIGFIALLFLLYSIVSTAYITFNKNKGTRFWHPVSLGIMASIIVYLVEGAVTHSLFRSWHMQMILLFTGMVLAINAISFKRDTEQI